jgi:hypothetical protein
MPRRAAMIVAVAVNIFEHDCPLNIVRVSTFRPLLAWVRPNPADHRISSRLQTPIASPGGQPSAISARISADEITCVVCSM